MTDTFKVAAAQFVPVKGDIDANIIKHCQIIQIAAKEHVDLIVFPELSLTGYEPELSSDLKILCSDVRLYPLRCLAEQFQMTIIVGAPIENKNNKPKIGAIVFHSDGSVSHYNKMHLHSGEDLFFSAGNQYYSFLKYDLSISLAICADTNYASHAEQAFLKRSDIYISSMLIGATGYSGDTKKLRHYAHTYQMAVVMANYCGPTGGWLATGKSAIWDDQGNMIAQATETECAIAIGYRRSNYWQGYVVTIPENVNR